jgi:hypothetical protein
MTRLNLALASAATAFALSFGLAAPAEAKITELKFHVVQTEFDDTPSMEMTHNGKSWIWAKQDKTFNVRTKVKIKSIGNRFWNAAILVERTGAYLWWMPEHKTFEYEKLEHTSVGKIFLAPFKNDAASLCSVFGGAKKTVRDMEIGLRMWAESSNGGPSVKGIFPVRVVCSPKRESASASADATPPARVPVALKVNEVKLYTSPAKPACGKPVRLIAEFHTNKPGKVEFTLHRKDGEKQAASITVDKTPGGYAKRWSKEYVYDTSITREYKVVVKGHPISTDWVPVAVKCGAGADVKRPGALFN